MAVILLNPVDVGLGGRVMDTCGAFIRASDGAASCNGTWHAFSGLITRSGGAAWRLWAQYVVKKVGG